MLKKPHLIQRVMLKKDPPPNATVDQTFSFEYMGSSEYEWGALPESLKRITKNFSDYQVIETTIKDCRGESLYLFIPVNIPSGEYAKYLTQIINNQIRLKESSYLDYAVSGKGLFGEPLKPESIFERVKVWWDIDNDIWFTFGFKNSQRIINAIKATREKKKANKAEGWY